MSNPQSEVSNKLHVIIRAGIAAAERRDYAQAYKTLRAVYGVGDGAEMPLEGLSYYGLCVAIVEKQTRKGVVLCRSAIEAQFYDATHFVNLIRLYLERGNRKNAVDTLNEGLENLPNNAKLLRLRDEMGYRAKPMVPFLNRDNLLNVTLGKARAKSGRHKSGRK